MLNMLTQPPDFKTVGGSHMLNQKENGEPYLKPPPEELCPWQWTKREAFAVICIFNRTSAYSCLHSKFITLHLMRAQVSLTCWWLLRFSTDDEAGNVERELGAETQYLGQCISKLEVTSMITKFTFCTPHSGSFKTSCMLLNLIFRKTSLFEDVRN